MTYYRVIAGSTVLAGVGFLGVGLWKHDWRIIVASIVLMVIGPLVAGDERASRKRHERLDRLWDDDEPSTVVHMDRVWGDADSTEPLATERSGGG